ncbi:class I SAM-dependent methyltransferase [Paracoccus marinaquae]|uniref:Methyltransferase domain-containing protein n=1 Tax=Paracoccus marinaquae TaxID=2841926 RepID=A0ABS6AET2_9RHOB|nr:methyltransferase domain-containing protein [Paracoccus marinaquae]MBU3028999.1 methyltransferase domain-containing protein [Paracoccus marinaquae]
MTRHERLTDPRDRHFSAALDFGREWLRAPLRVGAVAPSGSALARAMTRGLSDEDGPVLELGPGTGVFTAALLARGIPPERIAAIELGEHFAVALARRLPRVTVLQGDAARVGRLTPFGAGQAGSVVCGLPLLSMPPSIVLRILAGGFAALKPDGQFRLFTYGPKCPVPAPILDRVGIVARRAAFVPLNIPPASVYILKREVRAA